MNTKKRILIIGGGFGGISAALTLNKLLKDSNKKDYKISLISNTTHFEYHAVLYRTVTGCSPYEVCIPLSEIFQNSEVEIIRDKVDFVEPVQQFCMGSSKSHYYYDYLVLALGSETAYFNIDGVREHSYSFKNIHDALRLKRHLHEIFKSCQVEDSLDNKKCTSHVVVIGGGASGVELASEMVDYCTEIADLYKIDHSFVKIDLIESADRILPKCSKAMSDAALTRLEDLGVNIIVNRRVQKEDFDTLYLEGAKLKTKTVIWTAGILANPLFRHISHFKLNHKGQVVVDTNLNPSGFNNIFIIGDSADTKYSGWAQTALYDGEFCAKRILGMSSGSNLSEAYTPTTPLNVIPMGKHWALTEINKHLISGLFGWIIRRSIDLWIYTRILPFSKAIMVFFSTWKYRESCETCNTA